MRNFLTSVLVVLMLWFGTGSAFAQLSQVVSQASVYSPPSPNASALLRYANVPVDEHTGVPSVVMPIDQLSGRQLTMPITLSYHGSGNKVLDIASNVGLGMVLNAGGVVTRVMRGLPDEATSGYQYTGRRILSNTVDSAYLNATINGKIDSEPDMFYFNFLGHTGKMVIDTLGHAQYLPDQGIRVISHPIHNSTDSTHNAWVLKDFSGTTYIFGSDTTSQELTVVNLAGQSSNAITYTSSWYLAKVISPDGKETVLFHYSSGPNLFYEQWRYVTTYNIHHEVTDRRKSLFGHGISHRDDLSATNVNNNDVSTVIQVLSPKYLSNIQNDMGSVTFSYGSRQDLSGGQSLYQIKIFNIYDSATPLKTYTFNESYFISPNAPNPTYPDAKRLRLDCVTLQGRSAEIKQLFAFTYNQQTLLPQRNSDQFDHWGYYTTTDDRGSNPPINLTQDQGNYDDGFDRRAPDSNKMKACILTRVRNINGGYTNFSYNIDDYQFNSTQHIGGGLRISAIVENDSLGQVVPIVKNYTYLKDDGTSSGMVYNAKPYYIQGILNYQAGTVVKPIPSLLEYEINQYKSPLAIIGTVSEVALTIIGVSSPVGLLIDVGISILAPALADAFQFLFHRTHRYHYDSPPFALSTTPLNNLFDINGASVTYSQVEVNNADGGKVIDYYTSQQQYPDSASSAVLNCLAQGVKAVYGNAGSYPPSTSFDFERGLLTQSKSYDNNNNLVSMVTNTYQLSKRAAVVSGQRASVSGYASLANGGFQVITYNVGLYKEISENIQLAQSVTQLFDQSNTGASVTTTHNYTWQPTYPTLLHSESSPRSDGNLLVNYTSYPMEYSAGTPFLDNMVSHYMLAAPIERVSTLVYQSTGSVSVVGGVINRYKTGGLGLLDTVFSIRASNPIPQASFKFSNQAMGVINGTNGAYNIDKSYIAKAFYQLYDSKNNLIQSQNIGEPASSVIWGYNQDVPIAKISNATVAQVAYSGFETNDQQYWLFTASGRDSSGLAKTGKVRYQLSAGQVKTTAALPAGTYIVSLWTQGTKPTIGGTTADVSIVNGESDNHLWNFYMDRITVAAGSQVTLTGSGLIDELRLYPFGAHMSTVNVTPQVGTSSVSSPDDKVNTYEYDALLRLKTERDDQYNILKKYDYSNIPQVACSSVPDTWIGINLTCFTDRTGFTPNITNYTAVAANSFGNVICGFSRTSADAGYLAQVNYTISFSDSTTYSSSTLIPNGLLSNLTSPSLAGKSAESVIKIGIDTVINVTDDNATTYQRYQNRQRVRDGYTEPNTLNILFNQGIGPYISPIRSSAGCSLLFNNQAQTSFSKNNCSTGIGSIVTYTVPANTYTASTQFKADSMARAAGQAYANTNGNCAAVDTSFVGINPYCVTSTADAGTPTLSAYTVFAHNYIFSNFYVMQITRTSAEAVHDATVNYKLLFTDGSSVSYSTPMYKNQANIYLSPPLSGYGISSIKSASIVSVSYSALRRLAYANRQRLLNGVPDGYQEPNTTGTYYLAPIENPSACGTWYYNVAQTGFYKNDCSAGGPGSLVTYTVNAHTDSSMVSQTYADALSRVRGQAYANSHGNCYTGQTMVTTFAGTGTAGYVDGNIASAEFNNPTCMAIDGSGNFYVADNGGLMIRKITPDGTVSTVAGQNAVGFVNGTGTAAKFNNINGLAVDASGNIYAADFRNFAVRKITPAGVVTTFAGGSSGHVDGQGTAAKFDYMDDITIDRSGNFYVMEGYEDNGMRIRKITPGGLVSTYAGAGTAGNVDGPYSTAEFASYQDITVDASGNIYKSDFLLNGTNSAYIRKVAGGTVATLAGDLNHAGATINGTGTAAAFSHNTGHLTTDASGNIYLADFQATNVRKITPAGVVTTVAGFTVPGYVNGPASAAYFYRPNGIVVDAAGNLYLTDSSNNVIRKITFPH